ncbi:MAG: sugar ABC transporter permease [Lachnospiraceae bacterium]|nr:ABC transporter permease subunit [uncultured Acetatifactor sp.]MCI8543085.1 sugar ABC transporter permease [Lachnospiraceae bacterium]
MGKMESSYYRKRPFNYRLKKYRLLLPLVMIGLIYYFVFNYIPIIWGFMISLKDMKVGSTISSAPWVGLENYRYVINNPEMMKLLRNTLTISISRLIFTFFPPIILTIIIFDLRSSKFKKIGQTMVYIPHFFSWVIIYGIVFAFFSESGLINAVISKFGGSTYPFMTSSKVFVPLIVGSQVWKEAGWSTILYFAALTSVNPELYEAAKIDGAGPVARIRAVTLPAMVPVISFSLIMAMGNILNTDFEQILLFYNAAVYDVADVIETWVYRVGLGKMQYGVGSAVSMMKAVVSLVLVVSANAASRKIAGRGMF